MNESGTVFPLVGTRRPGITKSDMDKLQRFRDAVKGKPAPDLIGWAIAQFPLDKVALATSFGAEDQVLTDIVCRLTAGLRVFALDTGRFFQETYDVMHRTQEHYGIPIDLYAPDPKELADLVRRKGPNLFYESVENRKACCNVRKMQPLKKALEGMEAWICGNRRDQALTRADLEPLEWDDANGLIRICPLCYWTEDDVWNYIRQNRIPYNALHDQGFRSIGCAPCTRAVRPGEDVRSGRWWWESPEHKECGLHNRPRQRQQ
jgi:phosphoadenosine phosphosulfate reductase